MADYYAAYLGETHGVDVFEQVQNCLIPDELHMRAWDLAITALSPYDDFAWNKYIETIYMLDNYNYQPCDDFKGLSDILAKEADRHEAFWAQEGAKEILDANAAKYGHDIEATVLVIQDAWDNADAPMAGMAYAHFWKLLLDEPDH